MESKIGRNPRQVDVNETSNRALLEHRGDMPGLVEFARKKDKGIIFTSETRTAQPDVWNKLPGIHQAMIIDGNQRFLLDSQGNGVFQPESKSAAQQGSK